MMMWAFLVVALLFAGYFLFQSVLLYLRPAGRRATKVRPVPRRSFLPPELVALEAQFYLAPKRALAEARELLTALDVPVDAFSNVADLSAFTAALQEAQSFMANRNADLVRASRTAR